MARSAFILTVLAVLAAGCTREVYLQPVPCEEGCAPCAEEPCFAREADCCPELKAVTVRQTYYVSDVPSAPTTYVPCDNGSVRRCRTVCRERRVK